MGSILNTNDKLVIHTHGQGTLQTPKGKALFKIRKHLRTKDQSYFLPVKVDSDYFHHERM